MISDTATTTDTTTTATQARLLGILRDGRVWSRGELAERLANEAEVGSSASTGAVPEAIEALATGALVHIVSEELLCATARGMGGAADPDEAGLQVSESADGAGAIERVNDESPDQLVGGAEGLNLDPVIGPGG